MKTKTPARGRRRSSNPAADRDNDWFETLDAVFPYLHRGLLCVVSKPYRASVRARYAAQARSATLLDAGLSLLCLIGQAVLMFGLLWYLIF